MEHSALSSKKTTVPTKQLVQIGAAIVLAVIGFYGGIAYQKTKQPSTGAAQLTADQTGLGSDQFRRRMSTSDVTAISSSSITVKDTSGTSKTYAITSDTTITKDRATATTNDIAIGDTVLVVASSTSSTSASRIVVNPTMGGGPTMMDGGDQGSLQTN